MTRHDRLCFFRCLESLWAPRLTALGFHGQPWEFRRIVEPCVHCVGVQPSESDTGCYLELAFDLLFLRDDSGKPLRLDRLDTTTCQFRSRVGFFPYRQKPIWQPWSSERQIQRAVDDFVATFEKEGLAALPRYNQLENRFDYRPEDITSGRVLAELGITDAGAAYTLAQIHNFLGNRERARELAQCGLRLAKQVSPQRHVRRLTECLDDLARR